MDLAKEKGAFPLFDRDAFLASGTMQAMDRDVREAVAEHGIRNALLTSIAPTGTISLYAGNVSSGIEPVFAYEYTRKVLQKDGSRTEEKVVDYAVKMWKDLKGDAPLPDHFVNAQTLPPLEHVKMQAAAQKWVDSSISKTINCPEDISFEAFKDVYMEAWDSGCKGCTTYRPNDVTGSVLSVEEKPVEGENSRAWLEKTLAAKNVSQAELARLMSERTSRQIDRSTINKMVLGKRQITADELHAITQILDVSYPGSAAPEVTTTTEAAPLQPHGDVIHLQDPLDRPQALEGNTYKLKWPDSEHAIYLTVNDIVVGGRRRPFEVFINSKNMEHFAWTVALTRMISAVFRRGGDVSFVVEELKAVFDPRGGAWIKGKYIPSILAAIGGVIETHLVSIGFIEGEGKGLKTDPTSKVVGLESGSRGKSCPSCGQYSMHMQEGCMTCSSCGHSKCG